MKTSMRRATGVLGFLLVILATLASAAEPIAGSTQIGSSYSYATGGIKDRMKGGGGAEWKLLVDATNLGGKELEMVEVTLAPGTAVPRHTHGSLEVIYVLSGTYEHEVNGKRYSLTPGMVGIVRPGDHVRHLGPNSGPAKLLIIWTPGGEAAKVVGGLKGTAIDPLAAVAGGTPAP
jgi:quercetin dioxygenase-like cupin family protein